MWKISTSLFIIILLNLKVSGQVMIPYQNDFETDTAGWSVLNFSVNTSWEWGTPGFGVTTGSHSGVKCWDINLTAAYFDNAESWLLSPQFQMDAGLQNISFWFNCNTEGGWDGVRLDYNINGTGWQVLGTVNDPNSTNWYTDPVLNSSQLPAWEGSSNGWKKANYRFSGANQLVQFRFVFESDNSFTDDGFSMDDFSVLPINDFDLMVSNVQVSQPFLYNVLSDSIEVTVVNYGDQPVSNFQVSASYAGINASWINVSNTLLPGASMIVKTGGITATSSGDLCGIVYLTSDQDSLNNSFCSALSPTAVNTLNYQNSFDNLDSTWMSEAEPTSTDLWQWGTPAYGSTTGAYSGTNCWDVNLTTPYSNSNKTYLYSPYFDLASAIEPAVSFMSNYNMEYGRDGVRLEYELNMNGSWITLGTVSDPAAVNWYNSNITGTPSLPGWTGNSAGWKFSNYILPPNVAGNFVRFRFVFISDFLNTLDGFSIDDFIIRNAYANDIAVKELASPLDGQLSVINEVRILIRNAGAVSQSNIPFHYTINGVINGNKTYPGTLLPGQTDTLVIDSLTFGPGLNTFNVYVQNVNDQYHYNDTLYTVFNLIQGTTLPYFTDFTNTVGWTPSGSQWQHGTPSYGATSSSYSPPACWDVLLGIPYYNNINASLISPVFDVSGNSGIAIVMKVNYLTQAGMDGVTLMYSTDGLNYFPLGVSNDSSGVNWYNGQLGNGYPGWSGNSNGWKEVRLFCNQFHNESFLQFKLVFYSNATLNYDGFSFDDFGINFVFQEDVSLRAINNIPDFFPSTVNQTVKATLINYGLSTISNFPVKMSVNGGPAVSVNYTGSLTTYQKDSVTFPSQLFSPGYNEIKVYTELPLDNYLLNDTLIKTVFAHLTVTPPYSESFDNNSPGWLVESLGFAGSEWELGAPSAGSTNSPYSAPHCWDINLNGQYNDLAVSHLYTPYLNLSNSNGLDFSFWTNYNTESGADGMYIEYSTDDINWYHLGNVNDPAGTNWYNGTIYGNKQAWSGTSQGWQYCRYKTANFAFEPTIRLRFVFRSDLSFVMDGVSIDDFTLSAITGIASADKIEMRIYPNPVTNELTVYSEESMEYFITDAAGRKLVKGNMSAGKKLIDVSGLSPGRYMINCKYAGSESVTSAFIKY